MYNFNHTPLPDNDHTFTPSLNSETKQFWLAKGLNPRFITGQIHILVGLLANNSLIGDLNLQKTMMCIWSENMESSLK